MKQFLSIIAGALVAGLVVPFAGILSGWFVGPYLDRPMNTPPPPYTDMVQTTNNALGGVANDMACQEAVSTINDLLLTASWTGAGCTGAVLTAANAAQGRIYTVKMLAAGGAGSRVCVGLGASQPAAGCTDVGTAGDGFGCSLVNVGDVCQRVIRPQTSGCSDWDGCHLPLWALGSASIGASARVEVAVSQ